MEVGEAGDVRDLRPSLASLELAPRDREGTVPVHDPSPPGPGEGWTVPRVSIAVAARRQ